MARITAEIDEEGRFTLEPEGTVIEVLGLVQLIQIHIAEAVYDDDDEEAAKAPH